MRRLPRPPEAYWNVKCLTALVTYVRRVDARLLQRPVQHTAGGAHEGPALPVLLVAGRLAQQQHAGGRIALAEDGPGGVAVQRASAAVRGGLTLGAPPDVVQGESRPASPRLRPEGRKGSAV